MEGYLSDSSSDEENGPPKMTLTTSKQITKRKDKEVVKLLSTSSNLYSESRRLEKTVGKSSSPLLVQPESLEFRSMQPGVLYVMTFSVRNVTQVAQRIRIQAPKTGYFALNFIPSGVVAPGIDVRAEVECQLPEDAPDLVYYDSIVVSMGPHTVEVPLVALKSYGQIQFNPMVNFGYIAEGHSSNCDVWFENTGESIGSVQLQLRDGKKALKILPTQFDLAPKDKRSVNISFENAELGVLREIIDVVMSGCLENGIIDVNAHVIKQSLSIIGAEETGALSEIKFGSIFYGESRTLNALLVNSGPQQLSFSIVYADEEELAAAGLPEDDDSSAVEKSMIVTPSDGVVKPFSQLPIVIQFSPVLPNPTKAFKHQFHTDVKEAKAVTRKVFVDSVEIGLRIPVDVQATVSPPVVTVKPNVLRFGNCAANDRRDILLEVVNHSMLPAEFEFPQLAQFRVSPSAGVLEPKQTRSLIATFHPNQLGEFKTHIEMCVAKGLQMIDLKAFGECDDVGSKRTLVGGIDKLPKNFAISHKFADPMLVTQHRRSKLDTMQEKETLANTLKGCLQPEQDEYQMPPEQDMSSESHDKLYAALDDVSVDGTPGSHHPHTLRLKNDNQYNDYLKRSRILRQEQLSKKEQKRLLARGLSL